MTRNGSASPFPNEFVKPPTCSSQTGSGSCGLRLADVGPAGHRRDFRCPQASCRLPPRCGAPTLQERDRLRADHELEEHQPGESAHQVRRNPTIKTTTKTTANEASPISALVGRAGTLAKLAGGSAWPSSRAISARRASRFASGG